MRTVDPRDYGANDALPDYQHTPPPPPLPTPDFSTVTLFEQKIAEFFGAPYACAVDSCTHGLELCLRYHKATDVWSPFRTYLSVPMLANKLGIELHWFSFEHEQNWSGYYHITREIIDAAPYWKPNGYIKGSFMCISFQHAKHLSIGRAGCILTDNKEAADMLRLMSYDGRERNTPWRDQDVKVQGYHYYLQPELAQVGLDKLQAAIDTPAKIWSHEDYPDVSQMKVFKK